MDIFNRIKFTTPESVEIEFTLGGIGSRALALIIDYLVLWFNLLLIVILSVPLANYGLWLIGIFLLIIFGVYTGYFVFFETFWQGQTPGKRATKIRVVKDDGTPIGLQQAALRALLRPFDEFLYIGALLIMFSKREKRLGDLVAGTIVIQTETGVKSNTLNISQAGKTYHQTLVEKTDLSQLLPDDFAIIREYLLRRNSMSIKAKTILSLQLAQQVQSIINLPNLPVNISADVFLEAVYLAYQHPEF